MFEGEPGQCDKGRESKEDRQCRNGGQRGSGNPIMSGPVIRIVTILSEMKTQGRVEGEE